MHPLNLPKANFGKFYSKHYIQRCYMCLFGVCVYFLLFSCNNSATSEVAAVDTTIATSNELKPPECATVDNLVASKSFALSMGNSLWQAFRDRFPFHIQLIGQSALEGDRSCTFLISEPPPNVTEENINGAFACYSHILSIKTHQIGL